MPIGNRQVALDPPWHMARWLQCVVAMRHSLLGLATLVSLAVTAPGCFTTGGILLDRRSSQKHPTPAGFDEPTPIFTVAGVLLDIAVIGITAAVIAYDGDPENNSMARMPAP